MPVTLAEELALLSRDDADGRQLGNANQFAYALVGANLLELAMAGRIDIVGKRVVVRDGSPLGEPAPDEVLSAIVASSRERKPSDWLWRLATRSVRTSTTSLVTKGLLGERRQRVFGLFPVNRYPTQDVRTKSDLRERLHAVAVGGSQPDRRTAALLAMVHAAGLIRETFPDADAKAVARRVEQIAEDSERWAGDAVKSAVDATNAAVLAAVTAAVVSSTSASATIGGS